MFVVFVTPYFTETARRFLHALASQPECRVAVVAGESEARLPDDLQRAVARFEQVEDPLATGEIGAAVGRIADALGPVDRVLGIAEQIQLQLGEIRDRLGLPGMSADQALGFRDKARMKERLRAAGVPVARHRLVDTTQGALEFASEVGYPIVVKPPAGAAAQSTFRAGDDATLREALGPASMAGGGAVLLEELVTGEEHSFDAFVKDGRIAFYSTSNYHPSCLEVMDNPWMQWIVVLPRERRCDEIAELGQRALSALGLENGMCHLEWFRRDDGRIVVSEVGGRPPGAQITTMIGRAHDVDCVRAWARLVMFDEFDPLPERRWATGAAYLRGQGEGRVHAVHGLDVIHRDLGELVTDARLPQPGDGKGKSYEGEGYLLLRHPDTAVLERALRYVVSTVRVELR